MTKLRPVVRLPWAGGQFRVDLLAGATVAAYLVPQAMAYAQMAGLPAVTGLWAILGPLLIYAFLGSSRLLSVGPESSTALMTATAVGAVAAGDPARFVVLAPALAAMVGVVCVVGWVLRLGFLADLLSRPVLIGYMTGIAMIMIVGQAGRVTGVEKSGDSQAGELWSVLRQLTDWHLGTTLVAAATLAALFALGKYGARLPGPLIAMVCAALLTAVLRLDRQGVAVVGQIPSGLPAPRWPMVSMADVWALVLPAIGIALVGYTDNVLTARAFASRRRETVDSDAELLALGTANLGSAVLQGFPVSSSGSRTAVADAAGARSQTYSLVVLVLVVGTLLVGGPVLATFPVAALGALVIYAAIRLIEWTEFRRIARFRRSELVLALAAALGVVTVGVLPAVLVAIALSVLNLLRRVARPHDGILGVVPGVPGMHDMDDYADARPIPGLVVYRYDSPLFFANAENFRRRALAAVAASPEPARWLLLNTEANVETDITGLDALEMLRAELAGRGIVLALARVKQDLRDDLDATGLIERLGPDRVFFTLPTAVEAYHDWCAANP